MAQEAARGPMQNQAQVTALRIETQAADEGFCQWFEFLEGEAATARAGKESAKEQLGQAENQISAFQTEVEALMPRMARLEADNPVCTARASHRRVRCRFGRVPGGAGQPPCQSPRVGIWVGGYSYPVPNGGIWS